MEKSIDNFLVNFKKLIYNYFCLVVLIQIFWYFTYNEDIILFAPAEVDYISLCIWAVLESILTVINSDSTTGLLTLQLTWIFSFDNFELCYKFFSNLFTMEEVKVLFENFNNLISHNSFQPIIFNVVWSYNPYEYFHDLVSSNINSVIYNFQNSPFIYIFTFYNSDKIEFFLLLKDFISNQIVILLSAELIFWKKILTFFFDNSGFMLLMTTLILILNKSTNLIYTLVSFLGFTILSGLLIIFWGGEYIGLCVLLIYGAAIPVLALYIIMLVNVDLIQWLFFLESVKDFTLKRQSKYVGIAFILALLIFFLNQYSLEFYLIENFYVHFLIKHFVYILIIKWFLAFIDTAYGLTNPIELGLSLFTSDIDKVATSAFKFSFNELFALVLLLLIAIIVVISISRSSIFPNQVISFELYSINWELYWVLAELWNEKHAITYRLGLLLTNMAKDRIPFVGKADDDDLWLLISLHYYFWVVKMGDQPYRHLIYMYFPWLSNRKNWNLKYVV